jgi:hypothetical protein
MIASQGSVQSCLSLHSMSYHSKCHLTASATWRSAPVQAHVGPGLICMLAPHAWTGVGRCSMQELWRKGRTLRLHTPICLQCICLVTVWPAAGTLAAMRCHRWCWCSHGNCMKSTHMHLLRYIRSVARLQRPRTTSNPTFCKPYLRTCTAVRTPICSCRSRMRHHANTN